MNDGRRIASNAAYLAVLSFSNVLLGFLVFPYLSRVLSLDAFGLFGFSMSFVVVFQVIVEFGFMISATAKIAHARAHPERVSQVLSATMLAKLILAGASLALFVLVAQLVPMVRSNFVIVGLFLCSAVVTAMLPEFYFRGVERMRGVALRAVSARALSLLLIVLLVKGDSDLYRVPLALAFGNAVAVVLGFAAIRKAGVRLRTASLVEALLEIREGAWFFASRASVGVNLVAASFVLGLHYMPASATMAQFTGASRIALTADLGVTPISDALYPHMVRTRDYRLFWRVYFAGLLVWGTGCAAVFIWAEELCVLLLGPDFAPAGTLLRVLTVGAFFAYFSNLFGYPALTPLGLAKHANLALVVSACTTVTAYLVLVAAGLATSLAVCAVVASANVVVLGYRGAVLAKHYPRRGKEEELTALGRAGN